MKSNYENNITHNVLIILLILIFTLSLATTNFGLAIAQETGHIDLLVKGHDGHTTLNALLINSSNIIIENVTSNEPSFTFENLSIGTQYLILLNYKSISYPVITLLNQTMQEITIQVFELTTSDENIGIDFHHISFTSGDNYLNITEYLQFRNHGDSVINNTDIKIEISNGFSNFIWDQDCCLEPTDFGIFFSPIKPLQPNDTQTINFKYRLESSINEYSFVKKQYYDTFVVIVTLNPDILRVISSYNLDSEGLIEIDNSLVDAYSSINVFSGDGFSITVAGHENNGINLLWIGTGILAVFGVGGIVYAFRRSKTSIEQLKSEENTLISELEKIEKDFTSGNMKEIEYLTLKLKNKTALEKVTNRIQEREKVGKVVEEK
jgi:hypothetical protein|tara:strand:- start:3119 stop:4255 length:1137 start_codon:yes stop_codon:yes gene_type:complete